jgi:hypothetical protein
MSFFKKLFGGGDRAAPAPAAAPAVEHKGYSIIAAPMNEGGQFRVAGRIEKAIGGETKTHGFIRADLFTDRDEAIAATVRKAQLIIDQNGDAMFR